MNTITRPTPTTLPTPHGSIVRREPTRDVDKQGREVVRVPLAGGRYTATLYAKDFDRIIAEGWSDQWHFLSNTRGRSYVRVSPHYGPKSKESVHRLVMRAGPREAVVFRSADTLDLRRANLSIRRKLQQQATHLARR